MSIKRMAGRVVAVIFGVGFCLGGISGSGMGIWMVATDGNLLTGLLLGLFGVPFIAVGVFVGYMGVTGRTKWGSGDIDMPIGHMGGK